MVSYINRGKKRIEKEEVTKFLNEDNTTYHSNTYIDKLLKDLYATYPKEWIDEYQKTDWS